MQEALDRAEKARKAALSAVGEGGKQKRRNSAVVGAEDGNQGLTKTGVKKNLQGQNKPAGKAGQSSSISTVEIAGKKGKTAASVAGKQASSSKSQQGDTVDEKGPAGMAAASDSVVSGLNLSNLEDPTTTNRYSTVNTEGASPHINHLESRDMPDAHMPDGLKERMISTSLLAEDASSSKRKSPSIDRQKGQPNIIAGRQGGLSGSAGSNHHPQSRELGRGGAAAGRGGRGHGGKASRSGNTSSSKYGDNGVTMSPRGQSKAGLLSPSAGGYQPLPYESSMAAAINAPGFVPYGGQPPYPFYPRGYHYGSTSHAGVSSSGSDSGYDFASNVQQGGQQPFMPYNMAYMPQQRPVTEIPGLDPLRYYILGQIEYYFSIHNLCMDQFLKEQVRLLLCTGRSCRAPRLMYVSCCASDGFTWLGRYPDDSVLQPNSSGHHR